MLDAAEECHLPGRNGIGAIAHTSVSKYAIAKAALDPSTDILARDKLFES